MKTRFYTVVASVLLSTLIISCHESRPVAEDAAAEQIQTPVTASSISRDTMSEYIELNATAAFLLKSYIKANTNGYLESVAIQPGQYVANGQMLFSIKTKEAKSLGNTINELDSVFRFSGTNHIRASESGYIAELDHQPGDYVQDGEQLAVINNSSSFAFIMNMPYELRSVVIKARMLQVLLPDGEQLPGSISEAMPSVDSAAQTQRIVIRVKSSHPIPENLVARIRILKTFRPSAVSVPRSAVLTDETQNEFWVMKLLDSTTAVKVPIQRGIESADRIELLSPAFNDSDRILTSGHYGLEDTAKVKIIRQPM